MAPEIPRRILFLVSSMQGGGAERVAALLSNHWAAQGHQVTLMPTFSGRGECLYSLDERVRLEYLADRVGGSKRSPLNKLRRFIELRCVIRETAPHVILSFLSHVNIAAIVAAQGLGVPVVVSERTYPPSGQLSILLNNFRKWTYPLANAVVMQTEQGRDWLATSCPRAKAYAIPNPVVYPLPVGNPLLDPGTIVRPERKIILGVGRLSEEKGFPCLVDAYCRLANKFTDWDLILLGEGPEREKLEQQVKRLGLESRVYMPGRVGNLADWYERSSFYVMSSHFEGFPNTLVEAMAHGLPAVSFDCSTGPGDIIRHGIDGLLIPPVDGVPALCFAMEHLIQNGTWRKELAEAAKLVRRRFSMSRVAEEWDSVLGLK
ncbi:glycosyltransferase family 4 protein [Marinobacter confluentis]|uniref:Glycosyltransferase family 4 protein n=1 Tax=Marinobacter confluentis TaxID=1697557 RepID=A0A4Z1BZ18_9GAMM|nr:glycosyltransferase family 4 protein [Marinobacter confluentis]TGN39938.1 glycosyltransferase family 4 protein [Marinobacter confluentis]